MSTPTITKVNTTFLTALTKHVSAAATYSNERAEGLAAFKRETFDSMLPKLVAISGDLVKIREDSDLPSTTPLTLVMSAVRTFAAEDDAMSQALKAGSGITSHACTIGAYHDAKTLAAYLKACERQTVGESTYAAVVPSIAAYCQRLNFLNGNSKETKNGKPV